MPSLLSRMLDDYEQLDIEDKVRFDSIKDVCGSMYRGTYVGWILYGKYILTYRFDLAGANTARLLLQLAFIC